MAPNNVSKHRQELGVIWYVVPLGWVAIAVTSFVVLCNVSQLPSELTSAQQSAQGTAPVASILNEAPVPTASSVFTQRAYDKVEHVQAF
jgi:ABC-type transport system involved in cytochrome c biogenesis permease subunit